ncbi:MAG: undecaprenyl-diphosphate phosphatase [Deltaproteobacteria bacterium]|nr:undecaprenyl-diphosphate phosphatase [Deltaproteobacteria bacterium]
MAHWQAVLLGIMQGLGEFLPISSSAHLVITPWLFKFEDPGLTFDVALHFGTLLAILFYFWRDWLELFKAAFSSITKKRAHYTHSEKLFWYILFATIPGAVIGKIFEKQAEELFRSPLLIALTMSLMGILLLVADSVSQKRKSGDQIGFIDACLIGLSQALAIIPGVSRSGVTITSGLVRGFNRQTAARFSFLLATPITAGACLLKAKTFLTTGLNLNSLLGVAVSATVGFLSIKYMMQYIQRYSYRVFVVYRFLFSILVVLVYFWRK